MKTPAEIREQQRNYKRQYRIDNAIRCIWHRLRSRAKERGISCGITLEDFTEWCIETGYHLLRGRFAHMASIDRIDNSIGYEKGNLQILTVSQNSLKENARRKGIDWVPVVCETEPDPF